MLGINPTKWLIKFNLTTSLLLILFLLVLLFFVPPADNIETENSNVKNELASKNIDKGKSILRAPPKLDKK